MSHMVKGKTSFTVENKDLLIEALKEAFPGKEVVENAQMAQRGRAMNDIVVRNASTGGYDIGFRAKEDGTYEASTYEPGYGNKRLQESLRPVYEPYGKAVARDMMKRNPNLRNFRMGKTKDVERNGKKMKRIRLTQVGGGGGY